MKAQILATGADQEELFEIRHDLEKAYGRAIELGYTPADDRVKQIVVWLAPTTRIIPSGTMRPVTSSYQRRKIW